MKKRVIVTGAGAISALGDDPGTLHQALWRGDSAIGTITRFDRQNLPVAWGAEIKDFDAKRYLGEVNLRPLDRTSQLAASGAQRELQLQSLTDTVSALSAAGLAAFANAVRDAVVRGSALRDPTTFAARLREAGTLLGTAAPGTQSALAGQLERVAAALRVTAASTAKPGVPAVARTPPAPPPGDGEEAPTLIGSLLRFHRLLETVGQRPASLDQLLAGPPVLPAAAAPATAAEGGVVPIEHLCYAGPAALERALSLRDDVRAALSKGDGGQHVSALLEEIFDLVKLGQRAN